MFLAIPLSAEVTGEFTTGKRPPIKPKYVVAYETRDQRDARKKSIEVVLSEEPVDIAAAIGELDPHTVLINQKGLQGHNYVMLWVRPGNDVSMNATDSGTQFVDFTGGRFKADIKTLTADTVAGHVWMSSPAKTMDGDTYTIDVTFSTPITHGPAATKLAAGGGEPGKALQTLLAAMSKKSWKDIKDGVSEHALKSLTYADSDRTEKENLEEALSTLNIWLTKKPGKITGGELRGDTAILEMEGQIFEGQKALYLVKMVKSGPRWVFDSATPAGMID